jgi:CubicO group peptidase (beta-lactamase class C family)
MTRRTRMRSSTLRTLIVAMAILIAGCTASPGSRSTSAGPTSTESTSAVDAGTTPAEPISTAEAGPPVPSPHPLVTSLGDFPKFPTGPLPEPVAASLQRVLDGAVEEGTLTGVTAAVIVGDVGSWSGAAGADHEGIPLRPDTPLPTASVGKTITAAQVLRLAEHGELELDDPAADYLPSELESFDMNGATVRHLLGMRSGIPDPFISPLKPVPTKIEYFQTFTDLRGDPAGWWNAYSNTDFVLLEVILEAISDRPLEEVLRDGVLSGPGLGPLRQTASGSILLDAVRESDSASLARWGYELYGGSVLSDASLRQMTEFYDGYGLGAVDFSPLPGLDETTMQSLPWCCYDVPAIGHGGAGAIDAVALVAFPLADMVVVVQAQSAGLEEVHPVVRALGDAAQP